MSLLRDGGRSLPVLFGDALAVHDAVGAVAFLASLKASIVLSIMAVPGLDALSSLLVFLVDFRKSSLCTSAGDAVQRPEQINMSKTVLTLRKYLSAA